MIWVRIWDFLFSLIGNNPQKCECGKGGTLYLLEGWAEIDTFYICGKCGATFKPSEIADKK